jgi:rhodanese-related sulfurtransferase
MARKAAHIFEQLQIFEEEIDRLEGKILEMEQKFDRLIQVQRNHLIRVKNHEQVSDEFISQGHSYYDLSPEKAWKLYQNQDLNYIFIDVSSTDFKPIRQIPEAIKMPWENFREESLDLQTKTTPIFVISEDGTKSILACELLARRGYYNCNNISGGYKYWKGYRVRDSEEESA